MTDEDLETVRIGNRYGGAEPVVYELLDAAGNPVDGYRVEVGPGDPPVTIVAPNPDRVGGCWTSRCRVPNPNPHVRPAGGPDVAPYAR